MCPGDIILTNEGGFKRDIIAKATHGKFSHAMIMSLDVQLVHATLDGGVFSYNPQRILVESLENITVLRIKDTKLLENKIDRLNFFLRSKVGTLYSIREAIKARKPTNNVGNNKQFCSRLVAQAYAEIGIYLVENVDFCTPNDFTRSDLLYEPSNIVIEATSYDIARANTIDKVLLNQNETYKWLSKTREYAQKEFNFSIETQADVTPFINKHPISAKKIVEFIKSTTYCSTYLSDKVFHPWRYDANLCLKSLISGNILISDIEETIKHIMKTRDRHSMQAQEIDIQCKHKRFL